MNYLSAMSRIFKEECTVLSIHNRGLEYNSSRYLMYKYAYINLLYPYNLSFKGK